MSRPVPALLENEDGGWDVPDATTPWLGPTYHPAGRRADGAVGRLGPDEFAVAGRNV